MFKSRKTIMVALIAGVLVIAGVIAAAGWTPAVPTASAAASVPQSKDNGTPGLNVGKYIDLALNTFKGQLNIDDAQLDAAFTGAVSDTLDQAVTAGLITANQAARANAFVKDGVTGLIAKVKAVAAKFGLSQSSQSANPVADALKPDMSHPASTDPMAKAPALLKQAATIDRAKYANLFITAFGSRLGIDDAQLDAAFNATVSATTAQAVTDDLLTADQAAQINDFAGMGVRQLAALTNKFSLGSLGGVHNPLAGSFQPDAIAAALGMNATDLAAQLKAGKSLADIAAAQHLDLAQAKQALQTQLKTQLDAAVKDGKLTQTLADLIYAKLNAKLDTLITKPLFTQK